MRLPMIGLWLASLALVGLLSATAAAQLQRRQPLPPEQPTAPRVVSGNDVGFRIEEIGARGEPVGRLVVRLNGEWVEARFSK
jgi:hypothetical protein